MHFEHNTTWQNILAKAKAENKYVFLDCYTTWCGPCKWMSDSIFIKKEVGDFYNANFINAKAQMDTSSKDDEEVKSGYANNHAITVSYGMFAYPTYLIFNPNGEIVQRFIGSMYADKFIDKGKDALVPETQYYTQLGRYKAGERDPDFLYKMAFNAASIYDMANATLIANDYIATQKDLYTKKNLEFIIHVTSKSTDLGFTMMLNQPQRVDSILGAETSAQILKSIIFKEEISSTLPWKDTSMKPDWIVIENKLSKKYPTLTQKITAYAKTRFYGQTHDIKNFYLTVKKYFSKDKNFFEAEELNSHAWHIFQNSNDKSYLESALAWSKQSFTNQAKVEPGYIDTYANILYKMNKKKEALEWELKAQKIAIANGNDKSWGQNVIDKINKREKTW